MVFGVEEVVWLTPSSRFPNPFIEGSHKQGHLSRKGTSRDSQTLQIKRLIHLTPKVAIPYHI